MVTGLPQSLPCWETPSGSPVVRPGLRMKLVSALQGNPSPWVTSQTFFRGESCSLPRTPGPGRGSMRAASPWL